jgi:hypothetical protein
MASPDAVFLRGTRKVREREGDGYSIWIGTMSRVRGWEKSAKASLDAYEFPPYLPAVNKAERDT